MPLFFRPRRPLLRGAVVGGTAFLAGRAGARAQERALAEQAAESEQDARLAQLEDPGPPVAAAPAPADSSLVGELTKLKGLLDAGALTQEEFTTAKQRLLAGG